VVKQFGILDPFDSSVTQRTVPCSARSRGFHDFPPTTSLHFYLTCFYFSSSMPSFEPRQMRANPPHLTSGARPPSHRSLPTSFPLDSSFDLFRCSSSIRIHILFAPKFSRSVCLYFTKRALKVRTKGLPRVRLRYCIPLPTSLIDALAISLRIPGCD
jgi:hypothetical protein